ncbi:NADH-dependent phenylglyoxylate dehydrogenase subunit gamma [bacterium HR07]|uniref:2-oxoglutarate ferredoxin oxidoreductase subunit gamma n=2 Tax=Candidatus Bipolaricaulota TaxID=67810 RepID=H5SNL2_9BACT|nr:2-oxoglutarate ferredoxin oxidoreductase subunit gamma [uncultured Acetothermia bacterium]BAL59076.1 2-oxoglutarate ferredoxin oxidoreductase subunit gamma [Candidatus Acetothermum autotrophicum]GBC76421.1 NADH-dependent phenylglyoxylate dehydrogenase subunit gamma [bacterium HR07]
MATKQIQLTGAGGQGLVLAGIILAEAAMRDGKNVAVAQSYGPEARLGASKAEVIISTEKIAYPQVTQPDILLCLSQEAFDRYFSAVGERVLVVVDATHVQVPTLGRDNIYRLPLVRAAAERVGNRLVANVVALGALNALTELVSWESLQHAVERRTPQKYREQNLRALEVGRQLVQKTSSQTKEV